MGRICEEKKIEHKRETEEKNAGMRSISGMLQPQWQPILRIFELKLKKNEQKYY